MTKKYSVETCCTFPVGHYAERGFTAPATISDTGLVAYSTNKMCYVAPLDDLLCPTALIKSPNHCYSFGFSNDSKLLAIGNASSVSIFDFSENKVINELNGLGKEKVTGVSFSPDQKYILSCSDMSESAAFCIDISDNKAVCKDEIRYGDYSNLIVSENGHMICSMKQSLISFEFPPLDFKSINNTETLINVMRFVPQSDNFLVACMSQPLAIYSLDSLEPKQKFTCDSNSSIFGLATCKSRPHQAFSGHGIEKAVRIWDTEKASLLHTIQNCVLPSSTKVGSMISNCLIHQNSLLVFSLDGSLIRYDVRSMDATQQITSENIASNKFPRDNIRKPAYVSGKNSILIPDTMGNINNFTMNENGKIMKSENVLTEQYDSKNFLLDSDQLSDTKIASKYSNGIEVFDLDSLSSTEISDQSASLFISAFGGKVLFVYRNKTNEIVSINVETRAEKSFLKNIKGLIKMRFNETSKILALITSQSLKLYLYDESKTPSKEICSQVDSSTAFVDAMFEPNGSRIAVCYTTGIKIFNFDGASLKPQGLRYSPLKHSHVTTLAWNKLNPSCIAIGYHNGDIVLINDKVRDSAHTTHIQNVAIGSDVSHLQWISATKLLVNSLHVVKLLEVKPLD